LINLSMLHQRQGFKSFDSLLSHLKSVDILKSVPVINVLSSLPRKLFIPESIQIPEKDIYQIKPLKIGCNQTLTDLAVQCKCLEILYEAIENLNSPYSILDIGAGSGYMSYALYNLSMNIKKNYFEGLTGIDIYDDLISHCGKLKGKIGAASNFFDLLEFEAIDINDFISKKKKKFDIIHVGFAMENFLLERMKLALLKNNDGVILAPVINGSEQDLTLFRKEGNLKIMSTFFSEMVEKNLKDSYKFFVDGVENIEKIEPTNDKISSFEQSEVNLKRKKEVEGEIKNLEAEFKMMIKEMKEQKKMENVKMKEMMENAKIKAALNKINYLKRVLKRL